nr:MAG TPA: hypothetical protein [Herelleviridae sp.]
MAIADPQSLSPRSQGVSFAKRTRAIPNGVALVLSSRGSLPLHHT